MGPVPLLAATFVMALAVPLSAAAAPVFRGDPAAAAEVQAALQKFGAERTWRALISPAGGMTITALFAAPDRYHVILPGRPSHDAYVIGRKMWTRLSSGGCREVPLPSSYGNPREIMTHSAAASVTVTRLGLASIDHIGAQTYRLVVGGRGGRKQEKLYVDASTGLPHRIEVPTDQGYGIVVVTYDEYGAPVTVNNPPC